MTHFVVNESSQNVPPEAENTPGLSPLDEGFVEFFVQMATSLSLPRSVGEIFGCLFIAEAPIPFDEVVARLGISKGSASQGLKFLAGVGAVSTVYVAKDRRTFYRAETALRKVFASAIQESIRPHLENNRRLIAELEERVAAQSDAANCDHYESRISSLRVWNEKSLQLLPVLTSLFTVRIPSRLRALLEREDRNAKDSGFSAKKSS